MTGGGGAGGVEAHELAGDLAHGLAGLGLGLGPVGAAHLAQGGAVAADVLGDLVQGVGGHQEAVAGLAALGGGVLDDEVLAGGRGAGPAHGAPAQLDEAPHPVLGVDHEVPGVQGQGVHGAAGAAGRQAAALAGAGTGPPGEVGLGDEGQAQALGEEAVAGAGLGDAHDAVAGARRRGAGRAARLIGDGGRVGGPVAVAAELADLGELVDDAGGDVAVAQELGHAPAGSGPVGGHDDGPALAGQPAQVGHGPLELAAVGVGVAEVQAGGLGAGGQGGEGPPAAVGGQGQGPGLGQVGEGGGGQVDGDRAAGGRRGPGGGEELGGGGGQVLGALAHPLGLQQHREPVADEVEQRDHRVDQHRGEGLHALHGDALADLLQHVGGAGDGVGQGGGALAHRVGEDQLAAGGGSDGAQRLDGALVGDGEGGDLVDLVAEEVHAHGPGLGGREDVEDAAAHGVLAAGLNHVDARVGGGLQAAGRLLQTDGQTGGQLDGLELAEPGDDGGQQGAHGDDEDADRPALLRVGQAAQDGQALGDGVGARREALVRQGLPGGHDGDVLRRQVAAQRQGRLLGLAAGGGDDQQGRAGGLGGAGRRYVAAGDPLDALLAQGHGGQDGGSGARRHHEAAVGARAGGGGANGAGDVGVGEQRRQERSQEHGRESSDSPPRNHRRAGPVGR